MKQFFVLVFLMLPLLRAAAQQSAPSLTQLLSYAGLYRMEGGGNVIISVRTVGQQRVLLLTDLRNDNIRGLFPAGADNFVAGKELLSPEPVEYNIRFERTAEGDVVKIKVQQTGPEMVGEKKSIEKLPIEFSNGEVTLKGDLYLPNRNAKYGMVILVAGSEDDGDRYSFDALLFALVEEGLAVLTYDKRGTGLSTGSWQSSGLDDLAGDLLAALEVLLKRNDIEKDNIGLIGTSEGGWVAPLAASRSDKIAYIVNISGGAFTKGYSFLHKYRVRFIEQGLQGPQLEEAMAEKVGIVAAGKQRVETGASPTGFDRRISYDPLQDWKKFQKPVLYLVGDCDSLEPAKESAARFRQIFGDSHHPDFTIQVFPQAHHMMFLANTCKPSEFERMQGIGKFVPGYWDLLLSWIRSRSRS